jgi:hypothetical protein
MAGVAEIRQRGPSKIMKPSLLMRVLVCGLLCCVLATPGFARGKKKATPAATPHPTMITAVSPTAVTISDSKTTRALTVTQFTEITVNGQKAALAELKPGMVVSVVLGASPTQASRIVATSK